MNLCDFSGGKTKFGEKKLQNIFHKIPYHSLFVKMTYTTIHRRSFIHSLPPHFYGSQEEEKEGDKEEEGDEEKEEIILYA